MIVIDNVKYACQKCIKGHRSSRCDHTDRVLLVVRRKGRPISQCNECREQRQKRQIHQKCLCDTTDSRVKEMKKFLVVAAANSNNGPLKNKLNTRHVMSIDALLH